MKRKWDRTSKTYIPGEIYFWELQWKGQCWYILKAKAFPYKDVEQAVPVKKIGRYWYWKGTYK